MSEPDEDVRTYMFEVCASEAVNGKHVGYRNLIIHVVSTTMEGAVTTFRTDFPNAILHKVERRNFMGRNAVMIDPAVTR